MSASTTLEVIIKETGIQKLTQDFRTVATESTKTGQSITKTKTTVDEMSKGVTTVGGKMKQLGSSFSQVGTATATTALSVVNLQRSYRDLSDSQIAVDKTTRRVSLSQEAYNKATAAVAKALKSSGQGSAAYKQALLDQQQALAKVNIALKDQGEALERQGDINQDFWMSLGTTALATGSTVMGVLSKLGGEEGIGGLAKKMKSLGSGGFGGMAGLTAVLGPLALAAVAAGIALVAYQNAMDKIEKSKAGFEAAKNARLLSDELVGLKKGFDELKLKPGTNIVDFFSSLGPGGLQNTFVKWAEDAKTKEAELAAETDQLRIAKDKLNKSLTDPRLKSHVTAIADAAKATVEANKAEVARLQVIENTIPATEKLTGSYKALNGILQTSGPGTGATELLKIMTSPMTGKSVFSSAATDVDQLAMSFAKLSSQAQQMSIDPVLGKFFEFLNNPNKTAVTKLTPIPKFDMPAIDPNEWFSGAFEAGGLGFTKFSEDSATAAKKIAADHKTAAAEMAAAYKTSIDATTKGFNTIINRFNQLHPKKQITEVGDSAKLKKAFDDLVNKSATSLGDPIKYNQIAENWARGIAAKLGPMGQKVLGPAVQFMLSSAAKGMSPQARQGVFNLLLGDPSSMSAGDILGAGGGKIQQKIDQAIATITGTTVNAIKTNTQQLPAQISNTVGPAIQKGYTDGIAGAGITGGGKILQVPFKITGDNKDAKSKIADVKKDIASIKDKKQTTTAVVKGQSDLEKLNAQINAIKNKTVTIRAVGVLSGAQAALNAGLRHQTGWQGTVNRPTLFMAGDANRREHVYVGASAGAAARTANKGGGGTTVVHTSVILDGKVIANAVSEHMDDNSSGYH